MRIYQVMAVSLACASLTGCSTPRMTVVEATTIGLSVTPGNGNSTAPQVTFAYKRAELALIPTSGNGAIKSNGQNGNGSTTDTDALSSLTALYAHSQFFVKTDIDDFFATGFAARNLVDNASAFGGLVGTKVAEALNGTNAPSGPK